MNHHNSQSDLHYYLRQLAEMPSHKSVCLCFVAIYYPINFQINLNFICFILLLQISLTVLQYHTCYKHDNRQGELQCHLRH